MKTFFMCLAVLFFLTSCDTSKQKTILVTGDSWAFFLCFYKNLDTAFQGAGLPDGKTNSGCTATTRVGMRAENWMDSDYDKATKVSLADPTVKVLYLSLGGNDLMNYWNKNLSAQDEQVIFDKIMGHIKEIVSSYQKIRPDIKILISGYDFPRFTSDNKIKEYRDAYEAMGTPTPLELNSMLLRFSNNMAAMVDYKSVFYVQHYGMMQFYLGNKETGLLPFTTLDPQLISAPADPTRTGGNVSMTGDKDAYLQVGPLVDAFHLSRAGFDRLAEHAIYEYLGSWIKN